MKHIALSLTLGLASLAAAPLAGAQGFAPQARYGGGPAVHQEEVREMNQEARIREGAMTGQLSRREQFMLRRGQERIDRLQAWSRRDGVVTPMEARQIAQAQNEQNRLIFQFRHNSEMRGHRFGRY